MSTVRCTSTPQDKYNRRFTGLNTSGFNGSEFDSHDLQQDQIDQSLDVFGVMHIHVCAHKRHQFTTKTIR